MKRKFFTIIFALIIVFTVGSAKNLEPSANLISAQEKLTAGEKDITELSLSLDELLILKEKFPNKEFRCNVPINELVFPSDAKTLDFGDRDVRRIKELLSSLPLFTNLNEVNMYSCYLNRKDMEALWTARPDVHWGWTLHLGSYNIRTDIESFSSLHSPTSTHYNSEHYTPLKYCWRIKALDLGHNNLTDLSFIAGMTELRVLILADNKIKDISPLANLKKLEYVELFMNKISDLSPLRNMENLMDLNICFNKFSNIDEVYTMPKLERLWITSNKKMTTEYRDTLVSSLPNVEICFNSRGSTDAGWRDHPRYDTIYTMFGDRDYHVYIPFERIAE